MLTITLCYENDRFTPEPKYVDGLPQLWWLQFDGETNNRIVRNWMDKERPGLMTSAAVEEEVVSLGEALGIADTTSKEAWAEYGIVVKAPKVTGFVNWPDPSVSS